MARRVVEAGGRSLARLAERFFTPFDHTLSRSGAQASRRGTRVAVTVVVVVAAVVVAGQTVRWVQDASSYYTHAVALDSQRFTPYAHRILRVSYVDAAGVAHGVPRPVRLEVPPWIWDAPGGDPIVVEQGEAIPVRVDRADGTVVEAALHPPLTIWHSTAFWLVMIFVTVVAFVAAVFRRSWREGSDSPALGQEFHGWTGDRRTSLPR